MFAIASPRQCFPHPPPRTQFHSLMLRWMFASTQPRRDSALPYPSSHTQPHSLMLWWRFVTVSPRQCSPITHLAPSLIPRCYGGCLRQPRRDSVPPTSLTSHPVSFPDATVDVRVHSASPRQGSHIPILAPSLIPRCYGGFVRFTQQKLAPVVSLQLLRPLSSHRDWDIPSHIPYLAPCLIP
jgi:hypothetical protein